MANRRGIGISPSRLLTGVLVCMFVLVLVVAGIANARGGNDAAGAREEVDANAVPVNVREGGPIVDTTRGQVRSVDLPPETIALTFDDGPDPTWTPEVLAVLQKYHVPGTFFVVGANVGATPTWSAAIRASGSELGVHTFSHPDLVDVSTWRVRPRADRDPARDRGQRRRSRPTSSGRRTPPAADAVDDLGSTHRDRRRAQLGYVTRVHRRTTARTGSGPASTRSCATRRRSPTIAAAPIVLMHDAGGDRSETVAALDRYIPMMTAKGYRFTTVTDARREPSAMRLPPRTTGRWAAVLLVVMAIATDIVADAGLDSAPRRRARRSCG